MIKCRTTGVSKVQNYEYQNNERWVFFYLRIYFYTFWSEIDWLRNLLFFYLENDKVSEI